MSRAEKVDNRGNEEESGYRLVAVRLNVFIKTGIPRPEIVWGEGQSRAIRALRESRVWHRRVRHVAFSRQKGFVGIEPGLRQALPWAILLGPCGSEVR